MATQVFGHFIEAIDISLHESLLIKFSVPYMKTTENPQKNLMTSWQTKRLSSEFLANYLQTLFDAIDRQKYLANQSPIPITSRNAVKYITNELLENVLKFHEHQSDLFNTIAFSLLKDKIIFYTANPTNKESVVKLEAFIEQLLKNDPNTLYFERMENNAQTGNEKNTGLGLLSLICDYSAELGWKFENDEKNPNIVHVTTMVSLNL